MMGLKINRLNSYQHCPEDETINEGIEIGMHGGQSTSFSFEPSTPSKKRHSQLLFIFVAAISVGIGWFASVDLFSSRRHGSQKMHGDGGSASQQSGNDLDDTDGTDNHIGRIPDLIWSHEFDGDQVDMTKWTFVNGNGCDVGLCGWGKFEQRCFVS